MVHIHNTFRLVTFLQFLSFLLFFAFTIKWFHPRHSCRPITASDATGQSSHIHPPLQTTVCLTLSNQATKSNLGTLQWKALCANELWPRATSCMPLPTTAAADAVHSTKLLQHGRAHHPFHQPSPKPRATHHHRVSRRPTVLWSVDARSNDNGGNDDDDDECAEAPKCRSAERTNEQTNKRRHRLGILSLFHICEYWTSTSTCTTTIYHFTTTTYKPIKIITA
mgnify:CR=1 FL=1